MKSWQKAFTKVLSSYGPLSYLSDIFISAWQKCCHFSTETQNKIFKNGAKLHLYLIALMDYGCPVRNLLWCTVENPLSSPNFQVRPKHILSATSAKIFRFLWFMPSLGAVVCNCTIWNSNYERTHHSRIFFRPLRSFKIRQNISLKRGTF